MVSPCWLGDSFNQLEDKLQIATLVLYHQLTLSMSIKDSRLAVHAVTATLTIVKSEACRCKAP